MKRGKKYVEAAKLVDKAKAYDLNEALELAVKWLYANDQELTMPYQDNLSSLI